MTPDWQLPPGVDRGLWDYLHSGDMVRGYDTQMAASPLARADVAFCEWAFPIPGRLLDLGCGTGRLCLHFSAKGYECVGVDLSDEMLTRAKENAPVAGLRIDWRRANLVELDDLSPAGFDYAACLFSTLGMVGGRENRARVVANAFRLLKPGGRFVLHVHNRFFGGLGGRELRRQFVRWWLRRPGAGDVTMPQAYGGAPLTLHHFTFGEAWRLLTAAGFGVRAYQSVGLEAPGPFPSPPKGLFWRYGFLFLGERPV